MAVTFEPAGDLDDQIAQAVEAQMEAIVEEVRSMVDSLVVFPGNRSQPVDSSRVSDKTWRVELGSPVGLIEEFGGTYSSPKAPLRRGCEAVGLDVA